MQVLTLNCGSSSLKIESWQIDDRGTAIAGLRSAVRGVGTDHPTFVVASSEGRETGTSGTAEARDHGEALRFLLQRLVDGRFLRLDDLAGVGHRVVHGGTRFVLPTLVNESVLRTLEEEAELAPLHNGPALEALRAIRSAVPSQLPNVAVFDTAFHRHMPAHAREYAIPAEIAHRLGIQRFGFHGLAHQFMAQRYAAIHPNPPHPTRLITLQLGSGCSVAAIRDGISIDTSMGFSPAEGLVMGTRSGDVDPALPGYLEHHLSLSPREVERLLNFRSGLLGVSGTSADMSVLLDAASRGDGRAMLAVEMFCYRARKYIGAYLAVLDGADAILFGGGVGENAAEIRSRICRDLAWAGVELDRARNERASGSEARISAERGPVEVWVVPVDEGAVIASETAKLLGDVNR